MSNRAKNAQKKALELEIEALVMWYAAASGGKFPESLAVDKKTYRGKVLRWLEPLLPGTNPMLIEEQIGDSWTVRREPIQQKIQIFT